jgi:pimeloyl-ACP methyl ester carboxylesterase
MVMNSFSQSSKKTFILVHGAWHGAWCWTKVVPLLEARGYRVLAIDLPGHGKDHADPAIIGLADYVKTVVDVANAQSGKVILVGHSMAGVVIAQAGEELGIGKVDKLIFLDAFIPQNGESVFSLSEMVQKQLSPTDPNEPTVIGSMIFSEDQKSCVLKPENLKYLFYEDCSEEDIKFAKANVSRQAIAPLATPVEVTDKSYGAISKYYILCTKSKDLDKTLLTTHVPCKKIFKLPSSHSPFFSMPEKLVAILDEIY